MVFGIEADIVWTSIDGGDTLSAAIIAPIASTTQNVSQRLDWLGTVHGRLGYAAHNNLLIYATGGLAYGHVDYQYSLTWGGVAAGDFARASESKTKTGWTVGGGGEYSFGRWSLKGEYLCYDLGDEDLSAQAFSAGVPGSIVVFHNPDFETKGHIIRAGVNFKFGGHSRQPVPLK